MSPHCATIVVTYIATLSRSYIDGRYLFITTSLASWASRQLSEMLITTNEAGRRLMRSSATLAAVDPLVVGNLLFLVHVDTDLNGVRDIDVDQHKKRAPIGRLTWTGT